MVEPISGRNSGENQDNMAMKNNVHLKEWGRFLSGAKVVLFVGAVCAASAAVGAWYMSSGSPVVYTGAGVAVVCQSTGIAAINKMIAALAAFA